MANAGIAWALIFTFGLLLGVYKFYKGVYNSSLIKFQALLAATVLVFFFFYYSRMMSSCNHYSESIDPEYKYSTEGADCVFNEPSVCWHYTI